MDKLTRNLTIGVAVLILLVGGILANMLTDKPSEVMSLGAGGGGEYAYRQFSGSIASSTVLKSMPGTLGSVIITEDAATAVTFYDATSTTAYSIANGTKIAILQAALTEGNYIFNAVTTKGLVMSTNGFTFAGDWTVTYK
jgi:hypothetical protein